MIRSKFLVGIIAGVMLSMLVTSVFPPPAPSVDEADQTIVAEVGEYQLTQKELKELAKTRLAALASDEYRAFYEAAGLWTQEKLFTLEAASRGTSVEDLKKEEIHAKIQLTEDRVRFAYDSGRKKYGADFIFSKAQVEEDLYKIAYENKREKLLTKLKSQYKVRIDLKKPENYVLTKPKTEFLLAGAAAANSFAVKTKSAKEAFLNGLERQKNLLGLPAKGPTNAPITLIEYADFHCGFCKRSHPTIKQLLKDYPDKIRYVFRHFPLSSTPGEGSFLSHEASTCALAQDKFWEYGDALFTFKGSPQKEDLFKIARDLQLNEEAFKDCLEAGTYRAEIAADKASGEERNVRGTPTYFFNGEKVSGALSYAEFEKRIQRILDPSQKTKEKTGQAAKGSTVTFDDLEGRVSLGPKDAKLTLVEFSDFHCPFCKRVTPTLDRLMEEYEGDIRRIFRHFPLPMHTGAEKTHEASECANEQGKFWEFHGKLFDKVGGYRTVDALVSLAVSLDMDESSFRNCLESGRYTELVQKDIDQGSSVGVNGTPAVFINGHMISGARPYASFKATIDALLAGKEPQSAERRKRPSPPASFEFKDLEGKPSKGPADAPVTIVEFSDFHCPFCTRAQKSLAEVERTYGDKVRFVWRHFPLSIHPSATRAHEASQCAFEQGKFWEFHDLMFANQGAKGDETFKGFAEQLGLDGPAFKQCLESEKYAAFIKDEIKRGAEAGVRGTPAFFVNGKALTGAQPFSRFKTVIDEALTESSE